jgi:hypothetical protein
MTEETRPIDSTLFPQGIPTSEPDLARTVELYKLMVASSESLVARRQGVNTFFLTINGAILTAAGLVISNQSNARLQALGLTVLAVTGAILALAWRSLIRSFGQLNTGKLVVINRIEEILPVAVYLAEWKALEEGKNPRRYRTFTSREVWTPNAFFWLYLASTVVALLVASEWIEL